MKKTAIILLALLVLLTGCQAPAEEPEQPTDAVLETEPEIPEETEPDLDEATVPEAIDYEQQTMYAVSMPIVTEAVYAEDGSTVFSHTYQDMQLTLQEPEVADSIIIDFLNRLDAIHSRAADAADTAQQQYMSGDNWTPYYVDILYSPTRIDQVVLSLYGIDSFYVGEGRPVQICRAANYNMLTGEVLTLGGILTHIDAKQQLVDLVVQAADSVADSAQLYDDYADYIAERFDTEESFDEDWYFTDTGLSFYFSPYEIAPYSAGIITLEIPYSALTGIIADDFFPPEEEPLIGSILAQLKSEADLSAYTQVAEIILHDAGEEFLLYADGAVQDVQIQFGSWNVDATVFNPLATVFACSSLTPGDGIVLQADIPDTMPTLRISYRSGDNTHSVYLSQSGKDGSAILMEQVF